MIQSFTLVLHSKSRLMSAKVFTGARLYFVLQLINKENFLCLNNVLYLLTETLSIASSTQYCQIDRIKTAGISLCSIHISLLLTLPALVQLISHSFCFVCVFSSAFCSRQQEEKLCLKKGCRHGDQRLPTGTQRDGNRSRVQMMRWFMLLTLINAIFFHFQDHLLVSDQCFLYLNTETLRKKIGGTEGPFSLNLSFLISIMKTQK